MKKEIDCTVIGDAMTDVILPLSNINDIFCLSQGGVTNTRVRISPGGAANVAFYVSKLGGKSAFIGKVGDDYFGKIFKDDLEKNKIIWNLSGSKNKNTGMVFDLIFPNGERFFIVDRGANTELEFNDINIDLIRNSNFLYLTGFSFQDRGTSESVQRVLKEVSESVNIVFNPGAPNLAKEFRSIFIDIIKRYVSILILNEAEGEYLTGYTAERDIISSLLPITKMITLTKGGKGSAIATQNEIYNIEVSPANVVDTTGAGDAYAAGFIYGLSEGWKGKRAGEFASRVAENVISDLGARVNLPTSFLKDFYLHKLKEQGDLINPERWA